MSVVLRYKIEIGVSSTSAEEKDLGNVKVEMVSYKQGEGGTWKTLLPAGATDIALGFNLANCKALWVRTNTKDSTLPLTAISLKKNSVGGEAISIEPLVDTKEGHLFLSTSGITALYASNTGTADIEVTLIAVGDG